MKLHFLTLIQKDRDFVSHMENNDVCKRVFNWDAPTQLL